MKASYHDHEVVSRNPIAYFWHWEGDIKEVKITGCDFDKHVDMVCTETGEEFYYKWGYVFNSYEDAIANRDFDTDAWISSDFILPSSSRSINPWKMLLNNKDYSNFKKLYRKERTNKTLWFVAVDEDSYSTSAKFLRLQDALTYFGRLEETKVEYAQLGEHNTNMALLTLEDNTLYYEDDPRDSYVLKVRHLGKHDSYKDWRK